MLVLEGKSRNRSVLQMGSSKATTLFSISLSAMLDEAFRNMGDSVYIQIRQSGDLFNIAHFRAKTNTTRILMTELLFANDSDKQGNTRTDRPAIYGRSSDQKESTVDWITHEDVTRQATKADDLLSTVFRSQKEMAPSSPIQGYHQEKPEAERHKYRLKDITLTADR